MMGIEQARSSGEGGIVISVPIEGSKWPRMRRYLTWKEDVTQAEKTSLRTYEGAAA
jgi:hypothetical protein